jgi:hypothetical protein
MLPRDPKVITMADFLAQQRPFLSWLTDPVRRHCEASAYEHVTSEVMVMITVTSLLITWGVTRDRGNIDGDDIILRHCTLDAIDVMSGVPCFGAAMGLVGWAVEEDCEDGSVRIRFPKFLLDNAPSEDAKRQAHADAQRRYRARKRADDGAAPVINGDITATSRGDTEKRREEKRRIKNNTPSECSPETPKPASSGADVLPV